MTYFASTLRRRGWYAILAIAIVFGLVAGPYGVSPGLASDAPAGQATTTRFVTPVFKADTNNAIECQFSGAPQGFRINAPASGTFADPNFPSFSITLAVFNTAAANPFGPAVPTHDGPNFNFTTSGGVVEDLLVKGGANANFYDFEGDNADPEKGSADADTYLHSPVNPSNDKYFGLSHIDVCYNPTVTKAGHKWHDLNANGVEDALEPRLPGWTIELLQEDGVTLVASDVTDANGEYSFQVNIGVTYVVREVCPAGWRQSFPGPITSEADCGDNTYTINLTTNDLDNHFGNFQNATKSGVKYEDLNADGGRDGGEPGLAGWTITATATGGSAVTASTTTGANGSYSLSLTPGSYDVGETCLGNPAAGWRQSQPGPLTSVADCGNNVYSITLASGEQESDNNFGNFKNATKAGFKFKDADNSGTFNAGDSKLGGWTIKVYNDVAPIGTLSAGDTLADSQVTVAVTGVYSFSLTPGNYIVCEVAQANWDQTAPSGNTVCDNDAVDNTLANAGYAVTLISAQEDLDNDFGNTPLSKFDVRFFDLTGSTNATISCVDNGNAVPGTPTTNEATTPETTFESNPVKIGTYTCTITIKDP